MINFPLFNELIVKGYGLFPGLKAADPGIDIKFKPGLTLIVGANGLGKTTLVTILFRVLTGPFDIPGLVGQSDLGSVRLEAKRLSREARTLLAQRVANGAQDASALLKLAIGNHKLSIHRSLADLSLLGFEIDGQQIELDEETYQNAISTMVGVWSFGDWILLLRHLVFYLEDRRALVWDPSAQRQLLRFLFLPLTVAKQWTEDERVVLALDSRMRNLNAAVSREELALTDNEAKSDSGQSVRKDLARLEKQQKSDSDGRDELDDEVVELEARRQRGRLRLLKGEQEREARFRELEGAKFAAIASQFPSASETARYIFAQLFTENTCLVCGHLVPTVAARYSKRVRRQVCVICSSKLDGDTERFGNVSAVNKQMKLATHRLAKIDKEVEEARRQLDETEDQFRNQMKRIQELNAKITERSAKIDSLVRRLPPDEASVHEQRAELARLRSRAGELRVELEAHRGAFSRFVADVNLKIATSSERIKDVFGKYAEGFLIELCRLTWSPQKARLGQTGDPIDFPAFELELTGSDFEGPVRRTGPEQVSASQREFIDLAFRMCLITVAGQGGSGSLVIDAPESSLDAVFVSRAADVLSRFSDPKLGNRIILTSNLVEGRLIPSLGALARTSRSPKGRIVDLFSLATPTAATSKLAAEYRRVRKKLLGNKRATI